MRIYTILFLSLLSDLLLGQEQNVPQSKDKLIVYPIQSESFKFYKGQLVSFDYYVENNSDTAQIHFYNLCMNVVSVRDESGKRLQEEFYGCGTGLFSEEELEIVDPYMLSNRQLSPKERVKRSVVLDPWNYGNETLRQCVNIHDSIYKDYTTSLNFFKPGKYEAEIEYRMILDSKSEKQKLLVNFEVLPLEGELKEEFQSFSRAYGSLVESDTLKHTSEEGKSRKDLLYSLIRKNPSGPYASTVFYILKKEWQKFGLKKSSNEIYDLFELVPKISSIPLPGLIDFFNVYVGWIPWFKESRLIKDEKEYLIKYLQGISHLDAQISEVLIENAWQHLQIEGLTNYAKSIK